MAVLKFQMCLSQHEAYEDVIICLIGEKREYKPVITERKNFSFASTVLTEQGLSSNLQYLRYQYRAFSSLLKKSLKYNLQYSNKFQIKQTHRVNSSLTFSL
jgi:hypothetical protein